MILVIAGSGHVVVVAGREGASTVVSAVALGSGFAAVFAVAGLAAVLATARGRAVVTTTGRAAVSVVSVVASGASGVDAELVAAQLDALDLVEGALVVVAVVVLDDALIGARRVYIGERDGAVLAADVLEVLPAGVGRQVGDDAAELTAADAGLSARGRSAVAGRRLPAGRATTTVVRVGAVAGGLAATLATLGMLNYDALAHEVAAVEVLDGIFGIARVFELDESERAHDADILEALLGCLKAMVSKECSGCGWREKERELTP